MTDEVSIGTTYPPTAFSAMTTAVHLPTSLTYLNQWETVRTGDGGSVARGNPNVTMRWRNIRRAQRDQLRSYCTGPSASVYIYVPKADSNAAYGYFTAIMNWPNTERYYLDIITDFELLFTNLVAYTPP